MVDAIYCARTFYALESLRLIVDTKTEFGRKSHERLLHDIMEFRDKYINGLKNAIYDYTAMVVFGEMRHGVSHSCHYNKELPEGGSRDSSYKSSRQYNPTSILMAGEKLFNNSEWHGSFGGKKWGIIANRVMLKDKISDGVYCDMCFSLTHNCSPYLDKSQSNIFHISCTDDYKSLLDFKFNAKDPQDVVEYCAMYVGKRMKSLIKRAITLGLVHKKIECEVNDFWSNKQFIAEDYILGYKPMEWGSTWLSSEITQHRATLSHNCHSFSPTYVDKYCVKEGDILEIRFDAVCGYEKVKKGMKVKVVGKGIWDDKLQVVFEEDVDGEDLGGKCERGHGLRLYGDYLKKIIA